jgi:hypothetical protein
MFVALLQAATSHHLVLPDQHSSNSTVFQKLATPDFETTSTLMVCHPWVCIQGAYIHTLQPVRCGLQAPAAAVGMSIKLHTPSLISRAHMWYIPADVTGWSLYKRLPWPLQCSIDSLHNGRCAGSEHLHLVACCQQRFWSNPFKPYFKSLPCMSVISVCTRRNLFALKFRFIHIQGFRSSVCVLEPHHRWYHW